MLSSPEAHSAACELWVKHPVLELTSKALIHISSKLNLDSEGGLEAETSRATTVSQILIPSTGGLRVRYASRRLPEALNQGYADINPGLKCIYARGPENRPSSTSTIPSPVRRVANPNAGLWSRGACVAGERETVKPSLDGWPDAADGGADLGAARTD